MLELPLFPLHVVLFPGMLLPLHIFEESYKEMINACAEKGSPFGVLLLKAQGEIPGAETLCPVGTTAHILELDRLDDGRMNIIVLGRQRFRVEQIVRREPYLVAHVELYPLQSGDTRENRTRAERVHRLLNTYIKLLGEVMGTKLQLDHLPHSPLTLAYLVAIVLQTSLDEKQQLLELATYSDLLRQEELILSREEALLTFILKTQGQKEEDWPFSPAISYN